MGKGASVSSEASKEIHSILGAWMLEDVWGE